MDRNRLQQLMETYGADAARWPVDERDAARALSAQSPDAPAMHARARQLDDALDGFAPGADAGAEERLLRALAALPRQAPAVPLLAGLWPRAAMLVAASVAGVIIGLGGLDGHMPATADVDIVALVVETDVISLLE